jgi:hypothetical protein
MLPVAIRRQNEGAFLCAYQNPNRAHNVVILRYDE